MKGIAYRWLNAKSNTALVRLPPHPSNHNTTATHTTATNQTIHTHRRTHLDETDVGHHARAIHADLRHVSQPLLHQVRGVRHDLHGLAQVVASPLLADHLCARCEFDVVWEE